MNLNLNSSFFNQSNAEDLHQYYFFLHVLMPNGRYNGQKLITLVIANTKASNNNTIAKVPSITFKK
jgi:hypothetical protein